MYQFIITTVINSNYLYTDSDKDTTIVGPVCTFDELKSEFSNSQGFSLGIEYVSNLYSAMRRVLGDGNCFYRSLSILCFVLFIVTLLNTGPYYSLTLRHCQTC